VLIPLPQAGFDPTEVAVPWAILTQAGVDVVFATPAGGPARADPIMVDGAGLYLLKWSMRADANGRAAYAALVASGALERTVAFASADDGPSLIAPNGSNNEELFDALLLPGGHCPDMKPYLEHRGLQRAVRKFHTTTGRPIAAICHGVVLAGWSGILDGRRATALPGWMERLAHNLTWAWMGDYYRTYPGATVQEQVSKCCKEFVGGPWSLARDAPATWERDGFVVVDGNVITARWPGDAHRLGHALLAKITPRTTVAAE
jgi:putative intracellular protease/amidase